MEMNRFTSVWDALEDDPVKCENLKIRSSLMSSINDRLRESKLTQAEAGKQLGVSQPRISALMNNRIDEFRIDTLVDIANQLGLVVNIAIQPKQPLLVSS